MAGGNNYVLWCLNTSSQVIAIDTNGNSITKSTPEFATQLGISENGTVWALSTEDDPDGGGAKIFWSEGDGNWNEIATSDPGGIKLCGYINDECLYQTSQGAIFRLNTDGAASHYYNVPGDIILSFDYGGGYFWASLIQNGNAPKLSFAPINKLSLRPVNYESAPSSFSVNSHGDCVALLNGNPVIFPSGGGQPTHLGASINGMGMLISSKSWSYLLSLVADVHGNKILKWVDEQGGIWQDTGWHASRVLSTYHQYGK